MELIAYVGGINSNGVEDCAFMQFFQMPSCRSPISLTRLVITIHKIGARKNEVRNTKNLGYNQKTYESGFEKRVRAKGT